MTTTQAHSLDRFCSVCASRAGLDPVGSTYSYEHTIAVEIPLPWPASMYDQPGVLPEELLAFRAALLEAYYKGTPLSLSALAIAPDPAYSQSGYRRVLSYRRPTSLFAAFTREEYLVPEIEVGSLCWALLMDPAALAHFDAHRLPSSSTRDLLICTHGAVDAACAKFGFPTYRLLRRLADESKGRLRAWRTSHFGGHVFAPTLIDMPHGSYWGYLGNKQATLLAQQSGDVEQLGGCYRGWSGLESPFLQALERELFVQRGWPWLDYRKEGQIVAQQPTEVDGVLPWADVRLVYAAPDGTETGVYTARVVVDRHIETVHSTGSSDTYAYPQYCVTGLTAS